MCVRVCMCLSEYVCVYMYFFREFYFVLFSWIGVCVCVCVYLWSLLQLVISFEAS